MRDQGVSRATTLRTRADDERDDPGYDGADGGDQDWRDVGINLRTCVLRRPVILWRRRVGLRWHVSPRADNATVAAAVVVVATDALAVRLGDGRPRQCHGDQANDHGGDEGGPHVSALPRH